MAEGIGDYIKQRMADGAENREILREVLERFPGARTSINSVRWYRTQGGKTRGRTAAHANAAPEARVPPADLPTSIPEILVADGGGELRAGQRGFYYVDDVHVTPGATQRGFRAALLAGGAKVAEVTDRGDGGAAAYGWLDEGTTPETADYPNWDGDPVIVETTPLGAHWVRHIARLPPERDPRHPTNPRKTVHVSPDVHLASLVDDWLVERRLRREMAGHIVFLSKGRLHRVPTAGQQLDRLRRSIRKIHPKAQILNDMPMQEAVRIVPGGRT